MTWAAVAVGGASLIGGAISSSNAAGAAKDAAKTQAAATDRATQAEQQALAQTRSDLQPFRQAGEQQLAPLTGLINNQQTLATDPNAQAAFVQNNPFFSSLANEAQRRIFNNAAAKGKVGSGQTAEALQNSILLLGNDLINQQLNRGQQAVGNRLNIAQMGQNAAAGQGNASLNIGNNIADLATQKGNAIAAGQVGSANAFSQGIDSAISGIQGAYSLYQQNRDTTPSLQPIDLSTLPKKIQL